MQTLSVPVVVGVLGVVCCAGLLPAQPVHQTPDVKDQPAVAQCAATALAAAERVAACQTESEFPPAALPEKDPIEKLEQELARREIDPEWSVKAEVQISHAASDALNALGPDPNAENQIVSLQCGKRICRLELAHGRDSSLLEFPLQFRSALGWGNLATIHHLDDHLTVFYITRPEQETTKRLTDHRAAEP